MPWKIDIHVDQRNKKTHNKELHAAEFFLAFIACHPRLIFVQYM